MKKDNTPYSIDQLKNKVLYYINYRIRSRYEVIKKLTQLKSSHEYTDVILKELEQLDLINDQKFIVFFIQNYIEVKKYGISRIKTELQKKGFSSRLIQDSLQHYLSYEKYDPVNEAYQVIVQKYRHRLPEDHKAIGFLARKGFSYSIAQQALVDYKKKHSI